MSRSSPYIRRLLAGMLSALLISCGGGITSSGGSADTSTGDVAGVYTGEETLRLARSGDGAVLDTAANRVNLTVSGDGTLRLSSSGGSSGRAQITRNRTFRMRADARTHFPASCSGGTVLLEGRIDPEGGITGSYWSQDLVCDGADHELTGELKANRNQ